MHVIFRTSSKIFMLSKYNYYFRIKHKKLIKKNCLQWLFNYILQQ